ncbi:MAG TPA: phage baseplate assembly protein V [Pyrinomonadaceae bacterium]|jgi:phage protein D
MNQQLKTLPQITIEIDGAALELRERAVLAEVRVQQRLSLPTLCELTFFDATEFLSGDLLSLGADLRVRVAGSETPLFNGQITAVEHVYEPSNQRKVRLRGYDKLHLLRKRQQVRAFVQMTLNDLINDLVKDLSLAVEAAENSALRERIIQFEQTDFELMAELAERNGLYFALREDTLHVFTLEGTGDSAIALKLGTDLLEARVEINADKICRSVSTTGWNALRVENFLGSAETARNGRSIGAGIADANFGSEFKRIITDENITDELEAVALAQAELDWRGAQEVVFHGVADGNPQLQPGTPVEVEGIAANLAGSYVLASVNHTIDTVKGFVSEISTALSKPSLRQKQALATFGIVTGLDDPENFGRVRVKLPNYNDVETDWMQVVGMGAGIGKGLIALPDIEDTVLVFFPRGELTQGIILGGLFGMMQREDWDWGIEENNIKRFRIQSAGNQKIIFDDVKKILRMENSDGSFVQMSPEKVEFHSQRDLEIAAPGRGILIKAKTIDFERAENVEEPKNVDSK